MGVVRHTEACPILSVLTKCQYLQKGLSYFVYFLHIDINMYISRYLSKLQKLCYFRLALSVRLELSASKIARRFKLK